MLPRFIVKLKGLLIPPFWNYKVKSTVEPLRSQVTDFKFEPGEQAKGPAKMISWGNYIFRWSSFCMGPSLATFMAYVVTAEFTGCNAYIVSSLS